MFRGWLSSRLLLCLLIYVSYVSCTDYGVINLEHDTALPNIDNGQQLHYIISNLPVLKDGEQLKTWQFLFTPISQQAIATGRGNVNLHVLRPIGYQSAESIIRQVAYIQTIPLNNVASFEIIDLTSKNIFLLAGDLLAISVPDNSVQVRAGNNNQGLFIPYGVMALPLDEEVEEGYEGLYQLSQMLDESLLQLCTQFTTYGSTSGSQITTGFSHDKISFWGDGYDMSLGGKITKLTVRTVRTDNNAPQTLKLYIVVGQKLQSTNEILIYSRTRVDHLLDSTETILPHPIAVNAGDYVGHYTLASDNGGSNGIRLGYLSFGSKQSQYWGDQTLTKTPLYTTQSQTKTRLTFTVETDIQQQQHTPGCGSFCYGPVSGGPQDECDKFGLTSLGKDDFNQPIASKSAQIVLVKGGQCYTVYEDVCQGTPLSTINGQDISHVTYCGTYSCPTTRAPTTLAPTTKAPTTLAPTTRAPTTPAPTTRAPTTPAPTTRAPTTPAPTTRAPTTTAPTTTAPTTRAPTTNAPTTSEPTPPKGNSGLNGDPQFSGFQGQSFQFHGLADEHFNLISAPQLQMNAHFVYLSSGQCTYNNTVCFQHPGTYVDSVGIMIPSEEEGHYYIKLVSGSHDQGLRVWVGTDSADEPIEIQLNEYNSGISWKINNDTTQYATIKYTQFGEITIKTPLFYIRVVNAEYFFNIETSLLDHHVLRLGRARHVINDRTMCHQNDHGHANINQIDDMVDEKTIHAQHDHGMIEHLLNQKYQIHFPLHGLIGQTWRNALVCGKAWIGHVQDYVTSDLFSADYFYNMRD